MKKYEKTTFGMRVEYDDIFEEYTTFIYRVNQSTGLIEHYTDMCFANKYHGDFEGEEMALIWGFAALRLIARGEK